MIRKLIFAAALLVGAAAPAAALTMEEALLDALIAEGAPGDAAVSIVGRVPSGIDPETLAVASARYDAASGRFVVQIKLASGRLFGLQGKVEPGVDVPVLTRTLRAGEIANAEDVILTRIAQSRLARGALTDSDDVVGFSARRQLRAGLALREGDFEKPVVVRKGDAVTVVYRVPGVELTARGKAMANGGLGDTVPVVNVQSHKQIEAVITGAGAVTVSPQDVALN
ncbi:MAG: flagellar basal body P-ring formation protein FlgA [Alphaproteobacteria bacterium]|nr:flagellar basal body P-ring formation protein FlgA [Alphaproteobacteria bacterium]